MKERVKGMVQSNIRIGMEVDSGIRSVVRFRPDRYPDISTFVRVALDKLLQQELGELRSQGVIP